MMPVASPALGLPRDTAVAAAVAGALGRRDFYLALAERFGSPLYVIEEAILLERAAEFLAAFSASVPSVEAFFPVKTNSHPLVLETLVRAGLGIEVSSGLELEMALSAGARQILFNGPAKTPDELRLAWEHRGRVTPILDSLTELHRLQALAAQSGATVGAGVRISVANHGIWRKFGIPLADLPAFLDEAAACTHVCVHGVHFHTSWNKDPGAYVHALEHLGTVLALLSTPRRHALDFIDIGGGFWPPQGEWLPVPPSERDVARQGPPAFFTVEPSTPIREFAEQIGQALTAHVFPHLRGRVYAEPGRWIVNDAVQILLTVLDRKGDNLAITDGGTNLIGWERFESEYFPLVNLSRPARTELPFLVLGSLCTPHDLWGRSCFGQDLQIGDILLIPMQGAYTYSMRQAFIKKIPGSVFVPAAAGSAAYLADGTGSREERTR